MDLISIIFIAVALAMDCFAIAVANGISKKRIDKLFSLKISFLFGFFQGGMFCISYFICKNFTNFKVIATIFDKADHWIAFLFLGFIGIRMIKEDLHTKECSQEKQTQQSNNKLLTLISLAVAVSIDAFVTGIIFIKYPEFVLSATLIIGLVSFIFTIIGVFIGVKFGCRFKLKAELIGGIILILIGTKILIEHLFF